MDLDIIDGTLAEMTPHELALTPRWVELFVRAGSMTPGDAAVWRARAAILLAGQKPLSAAM